MAQRSVTFIKKAANFAKEKHNSQKRKTGEPYFTHPEAVAKTVAKWTNDVQIIAAAYLHDLIEDTNCDYEDILKRFGKRIARYIGLMSRDFRIPKKKSLLQFWQQIKTAPPAVKLIIAADMHHNAHTPAGKAFMKQWFRKSQKTITAVKHGKLGNFKTAILELIADIQKQAKKY
jgi:(p)ppGpp synthase/HD superfamily hydrolase